MPSTLATADAVLKEDYKDEVRDQINQKTFITTQVEKNTEDVTGRRALLALHTRRSTGVGARKEYGTLPSAGNQGYQDIFIPVRYNYGRIELSGPVIQAMDKDRGSFVRAIKSETDGVKRDTARDVNRQIWGTADGVIAQCGTTSASPRRRPRRDHDPHADAPAVERRRDARRHRHRRLPDDDRHRPCGHRVHEPAVADDHDLRRRRHHHVVALRVPLRQRRRPRHDRPLVGLPVGAHRLAVHGRRHRHPVHAVPDRSRRGRRTSTRTRAPCASPPRASSTRR
jgi:hypothetical protein